LGLALDEPAAEEKATEINGIDVLLDDRIKPFVQDITLDYVKNNGEEGFMLTTGKEDSCSCSGKDDNCSCC
jgi:Fe-S cluster assembly iron-binding protein IscA